MSKSKILIILIILILLISSSTYAWFTYVQRKSLVSFVSNDILYQFDINQDISESILIEDLVYVDFEEDLILNQSETLHEIVSIQSFEIKLNENAPYVRLAFSIEGLNQEGLIAFFVEDDDLNLIDVHDYLLSIINPLDSKEAQMASIYAHQLEFIERINQSILMPGESLIFYMFLLGDYDEAEKHGSYLLNQYMLTLHLSLSTDLGGVS